MEKLRCMTFGWVFGLGASFLLWEVGLRLANLAWQAVSGIAVGLLAGYLYFTRQQGEAEAQ